MSNTASPSVDDRAARALAVDTQHSVIVSAPAGSGKTSLLVQRVLRLLAQAEAPEEILALTFTKKAAAEMRHRVLAVLTSVARGQTPKNAYETQLFNDAEPVLKRDTELKWRLLSSPQRLKFGTFDSFCLSLTQQLSIESGESTPSDIETDATPLYLQAAERLINETTGTDIRGLAIQRLIHNYQGDVQKLAQALADLLDKRANWLDMIYSGNLTETALRAHAERLVEEDILRAQRSLSEHCAVLETLLTTVLATRGDIPHQDWIDFAALTNPHQQDLRTQVATWQCVANLCLKADHDLRKTITKRQGIPSNTEAKALALELFKALTDSQIEALVILQRLPWPDAFAEDVSDTNNELTTLDAFSVVLPLLAAELNYLFSEIKRSDFSAHAIAALSALGAPDKPTELNLRLDYRIKHLLVDEYQDTNNVQLGLLERLTAGWVNGDGRTLFVVGDPMQSIYGFRAAKVSLFLRARELGIGTIQLTNIQLTSNFRSIAGLVRWNNQVFSQVLPANNDRILSKVAFTASRAEIGTDHPQPDVVQTRGFACRQEEAHAVADQIQTLVQQQTGSIAVLARNRSVFPDIAEQLKQRNIAWRAEKVEPLAQRIHIVDLHTLTRALHSFGDRVTWLALLRTPMVGLDNADLLSLAQPNADGELPSIWNALQQEERRSQLSEPGQRQIAHLQQCLSRAFTQFALLPLREVLEPLWLDLNGPLSLASPGAETDIEDYLSLVEHSEQYGRILDFVAFEDTLASLYASPIADPNCRVTFSTIHGAKGLEYDHVIIPGLDRGGKNREKPALIWWEREFQDGQTRFILAPKPEEGSALAKSSNLYEFLYTQETERERDEICRLLYVGCTRAARSLMLTGVLKAGSSRNENAVETWKAPPQGTLLRALWASLEDNFIPTHSSDAPPSQENQTEIAPQTHIRRIIQSDTPLGDTTPAVSTGHAANDTRPTTLESILARTRGDALHYGLQRAVEHAVINVAQQEQCSIHQSSAWNRLRDDLAYTCRARGLDASTLSELLTTVQQCLNSERGKWLFDATHEDSACELAIDYLDHHHGLRQSIIDRTFVYQGVRWIVDYKSSKPAKTQSLQDFEAEQKARYQGQLARYKQLLSRPNQVQKMALYFPVIEHFLEIQ